MEIEIPKAFKELSEPYRLKVYYGGRGGAKSESVGRYLLLCGMEQKRKIVCAREFQNSIKDSVHEMLSGLIDQYNLNSFYEVYKTEIRGKNGTLFSFVGLHRNISNIKSMYDVDKFWIEEAETVSDRSWDVIMPTIRAEGSEIIVTFNPDIEESPTYQRMVINAPEFALVRKVSYRDNPYFPDVLEQERLHMQKINPMKYDNIWEGNPKEAVEGAVYKHELQKAQEEGRIGNFKYDPSKPVNTYWDLGHADCMSIWFEQKIGTERYLIDFVQDNLQKVPYYIDILQKKGYNYDYHILPHDANHEHATAEFTAYSMVKKAFPNSRVIVNPNFGGAVKMGIEAVRNIFPFLHFDKDNCRQGLYSLRMYAYKTDDQGRAYGDVPHHDYSDAPDALRMMAMAFRVPEKRQPQQKRPRAQTGWQRSIGMALLLSFYNAIMYV